MMERNVLDPLREAGRVKVYKGNPRKNWQVLDHTFDDGNFLFPALQFIIESKICPQKGHSSFV
jgi:hypothetical protein